MTDDLLARPVSGKMKVISQSPSLRKLPVLRTAWQAYRAPFENLRSLTRVSWVWMVLMGPITFAFSWAAWPWTDGEHPWADVGIWWIDLVVQLPFLSSIAVAWHRLLLRGEQVVSSVYLRLDRLVWWYGAVGLILSASVSIWWAVAILWTAYVPDAAPTLRVLPATLFSCLFFLLSTRMSVLLPALAVQRTDVGWRAVWTATRANTWEIASGALLCTLPAVALILVFWWLAYSTAEHRLTYAWQATVLSLADAIFVIIYVGFLSFAYRWFFEADNSLPHSHS